MSDKEKHVNGRLANSIYITYDDKKNRFEIQGYLGDKKLREILIDNSSIEFYYLLKIATSFDYNEDVQQSVIELIEQIGHPLPRKHIRIEIE